MCGIAGVLYTDPSRPCEPATVKRMTDVMAYRGPDDSGAWFDGPVGLGHRRLSIIDLGGGHQPMTDVSGALWVIFNGEIYNYRQVRQDLIARGLQFRTQSDTEVILQAYAALGEQCVTLLNGMFAFAIWDSRRRRLFLARDRMGVKPLYYTTSPDAFVFGSEIKTLFASGLVDARARDEAFAEYLVFRQVAGSDTLFRDVKSLPPGCSMTVSDGESRITRYWSPRPDAERPLIAYEDAKEQLTALLEDSVRLRLISDVPVGTFCSGGVDSSLVTALASKLKAEPVNTFSVGFDEPDFDESAYATMVSDQYGTIHHELRVGNVQYAELFPRMVWHNDEPLDFANSVHIFALSELAKREVTVVLTGEGSDELFAGYPRYRIPDLVKSYRLVPAAIRRALSAVVGDHRLVKLDRYADGSFDDALLYNSSYVRPSAVRDAYPSMNGAALDFRKQCLDGQHGLNLDSVGRLSLLDQETFLVSILHRQDKMSMAAAIESRVPFMDYRIVEFANRLPTKHKLRNGTGKALVKDIARAVLPVAVVKRRKSGFGVPLSRWFRAKNGLGELVAGLANSSEASVFDRPALCRAIREHRSGTHDHSELLWAALNLCTWKQTFRC
jgi:asparagine synthase (glutamine-hydrolysing)